MVASCSVAKPSPDFEILGLEPILRMPIKTLPASVRRPVAGRYFSWGLSKDRSSNDYQRRFLESVDLLTLFILHNHSLTIDDLAMKSVARSKEAIRESIRRLESKGLLRNSQSDQQTSYALSSNGSELIERFEEAWKMIRHENPRIFPLKSYQCLSVPRINAEESPRLANLNETLESSA